MALKTNTSTLTKVVLVVAGILLYAVGRNYFVAATVNGQVVSRYAVIKELETQSGKRAAEALVTRTVINQKAREKNISVSQKDIDVEIKKIEANIKDQGGTLTQALEQQGMSKNDLIEQLTLQLKLERLAGADVTVSDKEVEKYMTDNAELFPTGTEQPSKDQIKTQLQQEKSKEVVQKYLQDLIKSSAIQYSPIYN